MPPELVDKGEMVLVGMVSNDHDICGLWNRFTAAEALVKHKVEGAGYELHIHPEGDNSWQGYTLMVGVQVTKVEDLPHEMFVKVLPACRYAVFTHKLSQGGYEGANAQMNAWLESGPYRLARDLCIQVFDSRFKGGDHPDSQIDFLIPVVPKG